MIEVSLTTSSYDHKPTEWEISRMYFKKQTLGIDELVNALMKGHCYTAVYTHDSFKIGLKDKKHFSHTYLISIDIDHSDESMESFIERLKYKPTIAYTTCRNGLEGQCRYRAIYAFYEKITLEEYTRNALCHITLK